MEKLEQTPMSDNELIAEFMGAKNVSKTKSVLYSFLDNIDFCEAISVQTKDGEYLFYLKDLIFDKSWDWLMPVVEKIENIIDIKVHELIQIDGDLDDPKGWRAWDYRRIELSTDIKSVNIEVLEFIHWFNSPKSQ